MSLDISETLDRTIKSWIKQKLPVTERIQIKQKTVHVGDISKEEKDERPIWFFDYQNEIYLGSNENVREENNAKSPSTGINAKILRAIGKEL